jgi:hypothetical protein
MCKTYYAYILKLVLKSAEISSIKLGFFGPHFALTIDWVFVSVMLHTSGYVHSPKKVYKVKALNVVLII